MDTFSALLTLCVGNSPVFDDFFDLRLNKQLRKQSWGWWFETPSHSLWRHWSVCRYSGINVLIWLQIYKICNVAWVTNSIHLLVNGNTVNSTPDTLYMCFIFPCLWSNVVNSIYLRWILTWEFLGNPGQESWTSWEQIQSLRMDHVAEADALRIQHLKLAIPNIVCNSLYHLSLGTIQPRTHHYHAICMAILCPYIPMKMIVCLYSKHIVILQPL